MADADKSGKSGSGGLIVPLILVLVLGAGAGFGYGTMFGVQSTPVAEATKGSTAAGDHAAGSNGHAADPHGKGGPDWLKEQIVPLDPIIVNVGGGAGPWLRLEGAVSFVQAMKEGREALVAQLNEDIAGYVRTTNMAQVQTAAGLEFLKDDLSEIVQLRTKGRAKRFVLRSLVVE